MVTYAQDMLGEYQYTPQVPEALPWMREGYVVPTGATISTNGTLSNDPELSVPQASMNQD